MSNSEIAKAIGTPRSSISSLEIDLDVLQRSIGYPRTRTNPKDKHGTNAEILANFIGDYKNYILEKNRPVTLYEYARSRE